MVRVVFAGSLVSMVFWVFEFCFGFAADCLLLFYFGYAFRLGLLLCFARFAFLFRLVYCVWVVFRFVYFGLGLIACLVLFIGWFCLLI